MTIAGWGSTGWGDGAWGVGAEDLRLLDAQPMRENMVRLTFNEPPWWTGLLQPRDASNPARYRVTTIAVSNRGADPRPVAVALVALATIAGAGGRMVDVWVDRPFDPYPSRYQVAVNQLVTTAGGLLAPGETASEFGGLFRYQGPPMRDALLPNRDIANPQIRSALFDPLADTNDPDILGTIPVDDSGDYAMDKGVASYKKRVLRRIVTIKSRFAHLIGYGAGVPQQLKRTAKPSLLASIATDVETQIRLEPETEQVRAYFDQDTSKPGLYWLRCKIKAKISQEPIDINVPFSPTG